MRRYLRVISLRQVKNKSTAIQIALDEILNQGVNKAKRDFALRQAMRKAVSPIAPKPSLASILHQVVADGEANARLIAITSKDALPAIVSNALSKVDGY